MIKRMNCDVTNLQFLQLTRLVTTFSPKINKDPFSAIPRQIKDLKERVWNMSNNEVKND